MSKHCSLQETAALLQAANKIVLCSHVSPDGDTLGSALSLMKALQKLGKDVIVTVDDEISKVYKFLPGIESFARFQNEIHHYHRNRSYVQLLYRHRFRQL